MAHVQALAQEVACYLGLDLSSIKIKRFADGEIYVQVQARLCEHLMSLMPAKNGEGYPVCPSAFQEAGSGNPQVQARPQRAQ